LLLLLITVSTKVATTLANNGQNRITKQALQYKPKRWWNTGRPS